METQVESVSTTGYDEKIKCEITLVQENYKPRLILGELNDFEQSKKCNKNDACLYEYKNDENVSMHCTEKTQGRDEHQQTADYMCCSCITQWVHDNSPENKRCVTKFPAYVLKDSKQIILNVASLDLMPGVVGLSIYNESNVPTEIISSENNNNNYDNYAKNEASPNKMQTNQPKVIRKRVRNRKPEEPPKKRGRPPGSKNKKKNTEKAVFIQQIPSSQCDAGIGHTQPSKTLTFASQTIITTTQCKDTGLYIDPNDNKGDGINVAANHQQQEQLLRINNNKYGKNILPNVLETPNLYGTLIRKKVENVPKPAHSISKSLPSGITAVSVLDLSTQGIVTSEQIKCSPLDLSAFSTVIADNYNAKINEDDYVNDNDNDVNALEEATQVITGDGTASLDMPLLIIEIPNEPTPIEDCLETIQNSVDNKKTLVYDAGKTAPAKVHAEEMLDTVIINENGYCESDNKETNVENNEQILKEIRLFETADEQTNDFYISDFLTNLPSDTFMTYDEYNYPQLENTPETATNDYPQLENALKTVTNEIITDNTALFETSENNQNGHGNETLSSNFIGNTNGLMFEQKTLDNITEDSVFYETPEKNQSGQANGTIYINIESTNGLMAEEKTLENIIKDAVYASSDMDICSMIGDMDERDEDIISLTTSPLGSYAEESLSGEETIAGKSEVHEGGCISTNPYSFNVVEFFGASCTAHRSGECSNSGDCQYSRDLRDKLLIKSERLNKLTAAELSVAYDFLYTNGALFGVYFRTFCDVYTKRNNQMKLLSMANDCIRHPECSDYLHIIFCSLVECGLSKINAWRLMLKRCNENVQNVIQQTNWITFEEND